MGLPVRRGPRRRHNRHRDGPSYPQRASNGGTTRRHTGTVPVPLTIGRVLDGGLVITLVQRRGPHRTVRHNAHTRGRYNGRRGHAGRHNVPAGAAYCTVTRTTGPAIVSALSLTKAGPHRRATTTKELQQAMHELPVVQLSDEELQPYITTVTRQAVIYVTRNSVATAHTYRVCQKAP